MRFEGKSYRGHDPQWAFTPLSGDGAAVHGGRFNPKGVPALYLALSPMGAINEVCQGFAARIASMTLVEYDVDCTDIDDLTDASTRAALVISKADMACNWGEKALILGKTPASWVIAMRLIAGGSAGIIVPSYAPEATSDHLNLVLW
ncbi:MAG TPA: RES domain-containing protein, partial [Rhodanobacter sp.]|nr:RES domain-containing protein [Rhodanobacter sp.]